MRKMYSLLAMMVLALGIPAVAQESIQNYVEGFDNLDTSNHEFAPKGWGHIVDNYSDWYGGEVYYVEYSNPQTGGQDGGAYLSIGSQQLGSGWDTETVDDILVTPAVSGNVSLYVKLEKMGGSIKFYTCTKQGNSFTKGAEYSVTLPELSETEWTQVTLPSVPEGTYLGIRGEYVGIDNFAAENATIVYKRELTIESAELVTETVAGGGIDAGEDGNASFTYRVTLTNTGEVDLNHGDEGYSISIVHSDAPETPLSTKELDFSLAVGATSQPVDISVSIPVEEEIYDRWDVKENISGTTEYVTWLTLYPHKSDFFVSEGDHADIFEPGTELQFGLSQQPVTKTFRLRNNGGAEATVTAVTAPEGFTYKVRNAENVEQQLPLVVPAHSGTDFYLDVTMTADAPGAKSGDLVIKVEGYNDLVFPVSGQIVDPSKLYVNFEDNKFPVGTYVEGSSWSISDFPAEAGLESNRYCAENGLSSDEMDKLILPKVHVASGETMVFSAARRSNSSVVKVYYSSDRSDWHLVRSLSADSEAAEEDLLPDTKVGTSSYDSYAFKQYTIDNIPEGDWYIAFESGYARIDDIMGYTLLEMPQADLIVGSKFPETATVNYDYKVALDIQNIGNPIEEGQLTAKFYLENNVVKEVPVPAMATGESAAVDVVYTPREDGQFNIKVTIEGLDCTFSEENQITVAQETPVAAVQVGTSTTESQNASLNLFYMNSETETIYTKDLIDLPAGTMIHKIVFRGYNTNTDHTTNVSAWIENTTDGVFAGAPETSYSVPVDGMKQIYDGDYTFRQAGGSGNLVDMLVFELAEPFEYTGENLRVVVRSSADSFNNKIYFDTDDNVNNASIIRHTDSGVLAEKSWSLQSAMPVMTLQVEKELTVLSGKVVSSKDQSAIAGAAIKLVSGNVEYSGVSGEDGSYNIGIYQDTKEYVLSVDKEGYFKYEKTVTFPEGSTEMDIAMDVATGFRVKEASVPASGMVNYAYTATVTIENGLEKPAGSYTAELYVNGEVVDTDNEADLEANSDHTFTFGFTPHTAGTFPAYVKLTSEYGTTQTEEVQLVIAEESAESLVQVGEVTDVSFGSGPIQTYYNSSRTEIIYTKDLLGLAPGSKIVSLQFKGYHEGGAGCEFATQVWLSNVSDTELKQSDVTGMTQVFDSVISFSEAAGSESETAVLVNVSIPDGFVYTGENIRVAIAAHSETYVRSYFEEDNTVTGLAQQVFADSPLESVEEDSWSGWKEIALPVAYFGIVPTKNVSGVVTDSETNLPVEGAAVTLRSGEVEYYAVTDVDGSYSVDVIQYSLDYEMTVEAEGYKPAVEAVSFADGDVADKDVALVKDDGSGVDSIGIEGFKAYGGNGCIVVETEADAQVYVYNTVGSLVRSVEAVAGKTRIDGIGAGIYIVNGVKVIVR